jgi:hypothetical protein
MDMTLLMMDKDLDPSEFVKGFLQDFQENVAGLISATR